jgi:hypothetical protein
MARTGSAMTGMISRESQLAGGRCGGKRNITVTQCARAVFAPGVCTAGEVSSASS